jgi:hypothetical protein
MAFERLMPTKSRITTHNAHLPESFRPLFWSYRFEDLDPEKNERTVIVQLMNYGTLAHWRWLARAYGAAEIRRALESMPATEINPRTRSLASLLFSIHDWSDAYRGAF